MPDVRSPEGFTRQEAASLPEADLGRRTSDLGTAVTHVARCYLYSPAVDPETMSEQTR
jgi:hypothetical protein